MLTVDCTSGLEQTIDQFFKLNLPMRLPQLKGLTNGFDNALQQYTNRVVAQLGQIFFPGHLFVLILQTGDVSFYVRTLFETWLLLNKVLA